MTSYYQILKINKDATINEIKKAYHKLAMKWHPDKNNTKEANAQFQKINEAYSVLSDENKRKHYDTFGKNSPNNTNINPNDIFKHFFNNFSQSFSFNFSHSTNNNNNNNNNNTNSKKKMPLQEVVNNVSISDLMNGFERKLVINKNIQCTECNATGLKKYKRTNM